MQFVDQAIFSNDGPNLSKPAETKIPKISNNQKGITPQLDMRNIFSNVR